MCGDSRAGKKHVHTRRKPIKQTNKQTKPCMTLKYCFYCKASNLHTQCREFAASFWTNQALTFNNTNISLDRSRKCYLE